MTKEAMVYCRTVASDIRLRQQLERRYPGRLFSIMYDEVAGNLTRFTNNIYRFIAEPVNGKTRAWVGRNVRKVNGTSIATKWQKVMSVEQNAKIISVCSELFRLLYPDVGPYSSIRS